MTPTIRNDSRPSLNVTSRGCSMRRPSNIPRPPPRGSGNLAVTMRADKAAATLVLGTILIGASLLPGRTARADEASGHYNLGLQLKREGKIPQAIAECEKALALRPDYAAAHLTLGNLWRAQGNYQKAAASYEATVKLQPKDSTAHANLGAAYVRLKRVDDGIRELEAAAELKPDEYETQLSLGFAYKSKGDYKKA